MLSCGEKKFLLGVLSLCYIGWSCNGNAQSTSEHDVVTIETLPKDQQGASSIITAESPREQSVELSPIPQATFSGFPGERVVIGGEEKRIWSTSPRGAAPTTPVPTFRVNPYVILPSYKTR